MSDPTPDFATLTVSVHNRLGRLTLDQPDASTRWASTASPRSPMLPGGSTIKTSPW